MRTIPLTSSRGIQVAGVIIPEMAGNREEDVCSTKDDEYEGVKDLYEGDQRKVIWEVLFQSKNLMVISPGFLYNESNSEHNYLKFKKGEPDG